MRTYSPRLGRWLTRDSTQEQGGLNLYNFTNNNPRNKYDVRGLAYFAQRPLDGTKKRRKFWFSDYLDLDIAHEQLFFEDEGSPANIGFFGDSKLKEEFCETLKLYTPIGAHYDDCIMRLAVKLTKIYPYSLVGNVIIDRKYNCQNYALDLRATYNRIHTLQWAKNACCGKEER